jgi:hypothetical protein
MIESCSIWHIIGTFRFRFRWHMYGLRVIRQCSPNLSQRLWAKLSEMPLLAWTCIKQA